MKNLLLFAIIMLALTEDIKCPINIDTTVSCTKEYIPVCGYSSEDYQQGTFENSCFACRAKNVVYYKSEPCLVQIVSPSPPETSTSTNTNSNSSTSSSTSSQIFKCDGPKVENPICPEYYKQTCGLFNSNIQCIKAPCGQTFSNECFACGNANVDTYFFGDCNQMPQEQPQPQPSQSDYIKCQEPRPEMCTMIYTDTCAFTEFPCYSDSCMSLTGSGCQACSNKNVVGYVQQSCSKYQLIYQSNLADDSGTETKDLTGGNVEYECSITRPTNCDDNVNEVCASQKCNDTVCKKEYSNECQACLDSSTTSYSKGKCDSASSGTILGLAILINLFI
ncbi:unnamed protein product [Paramecium sonneborni]|uniref:Kazal-like domain-containing protein n=1 Tax=Paramecium sonneborni TaxID=65129 RepID=A0A8S1PBB4_9CILI|nr:unnamed protein product [Paramecium sonneborni]